MNLIKQKLAKYLILKEQETEDNEEEEEGQLQPDTEMFVVKKGNAYTCISNGMFKFLDMSQFLAPGSSYASFIKSYGCELEKGFMCYEWLDNIEKLSHTSLPPIEAFYSKLKGFNVLEADRIPFDKLIGEGKTKEEALVILGLTSEPPTKEEVYEGLKRVWVDKGMTTFADYLKFYNCLDVIGFVQGTKAVHEFYQKTLRVDLFKEAISVPGVARKLLFRCARQAQASFSLFPEKHADLYQKIRNNLIGGPSIIFRRHSKAGQTVLRDADASITDRQKCQRVVGYDANALYLWAIGQDMPVSFYIRRKENVEDPEQNFKPDKSWKWFTMFHWMDWLILKQNANISHQQNSGREHKIGKYRVDGFDEMSKTCYEYNGCYWHACARCGYNLTEKGAKRWEKTQKRKAFLKRKGFNVVEKWECEFNRERKENKELDSFIKSRLPSFYNKYGNKSVSMDQILSAVKDDEFFGMIECDIECPEQWDPEHVRSIPPEAYFGEMCPLFVTCKIPFELIGEKMQKFVKDNNMSQKDRTLLVGGMKAQKVLLASPLVKFYLDHGMKITRIYETVEYQKMPCFRKFAEEVTKHRRAGDIDSKKAMQAATMKLIGNSGYGSLIMDKSKHRQVKYVDSKPRACMLVNRRRFRKLTELSDQYFEVEMAKESIALDLPIQLGYWILQLAKLRMLQFYYDLVDKYCDRRMFEYNEMDTDSAYYSIAGPCLEQIVREDMREQFYNEWPDWFPAESCTTHHDEWVRTKLARSEWDVRDKACCRNRKLADKRTPGLFKLEYEGNEIIGLCSKTYYVQGDKDAKFSAKGVNKSSVKPEHYRDVLENETVKSVKNTGIRPHAKSVASYKQEKIGFNYFSCKRRVLDDGINTKPLDVVLTPIEKPLVPGNPGEDLLEH